MTSGSRSIVVTGAASGIGRATVLRLLEDSGTSVVGIDLREEPLFSLADGRTGFIPVVGSVTDRSVLEAAADLAEGAAGLGGWVHNAADFSTGPLLEATDASIQSSLAVNLLAIVNGSQVALEHFVKRGVPGSIVMISSIHAVRAYPGWALYAAAKAATEALARSIAVDYGGLGVRANCVAPGLIETDANRAYVRELLQRGGPGFRPGDRPGSGRPEQVAAVVAFLLSAAAVHMNGARVEVDAGESVAGYPPTMLDAQDGLVPSNSGQRVDMGVSSNTK